MKKHIYYIMYEPTLDFESFGGNESFVDTFFFSSREEAVDYLENEMKYPKIEEDNVEYESGIDKYRVSYDTVAKVYVLTQYQKD